MLVTEPPRQLHRVPCIQQAEPCPSIAPPDPRQWQAQRLGQACYSAGQRGGRGEEQLVIISSSGSPQPRRLVVPDSRKMGI